MSAHSTRVLRAILTSSLAVAMLAVPVHGRAQSEPAKATDSSGKQSEKAREKEKEDEANGWHARWAEHPELAYGKDTHIGFTARWQADAQSGGDDGGDFSALDIARRRIGVEGRLFDRVDFEADYELGDDEPWRDAFVEYRGSRVVRVRAGQFKLPFSIDENTSAARLDFVYRSLAASQLAPGRDPGVMANGRVLDGLLHYEAGWFGKDGRNARTRNPERVHGGATLAGRLVFEPLRGSRSPLYRDLQVGVAATSSDVPEGMPGLRGRTTFDGTFFEPDVWVRGRRTRTGLEARWRPGPFAVKAEYIRMATERQGEGVDDGDLPPLEGKGWYVSGTWIATGESKRDGPEIPRRPVWRGGPGAVELGARLEGLSYGSEATAGEVPSTSPRAASILGNSLRAATLGVNWYPVRGVKLQFNVIRESLADPSQGPTPSQPVVWSRVLRIQFAL